MRFATPNASCALIDIAAGMGHVRDFATNSDGYAALYPPCNTPTNLDTVGRVKKQRDVPVMTHRQERIAPAISVLKP